MAERASDQTGHPSAWSRASDIDFHALADFALVASHGGFGRASRATGRSKATLSRRVVRLEDALGVRLFERGARVLRLTDKGDALFARSTRLLDELSNSVETASADEQPSGRLRVSAPLLFAHIALGRIAASFMAAYPKVRLEIEADDRFVDLVEDGYDVVIRTNPRMSDDLVGRCIFRDRLLLVAPPGQACPEPSGGEPPTLPAVLLSGTSDQALWTVRDAGTAFQFRPHAVLRVPSLLVARDAVRAGAGAALLPLSIAAEDIAAGKLTRWGDVGGRDVEIWVLHRSRRLVSAKVSAFVEFVAAALPGTSLS